MSGDFLREARRRAGLTQQVVARRAGVSQSLVARIEGGEVEPSLERLLGLVRACGLDLQIHVTPLDEDAWTLVERGAAVTPDERLQRMLEGLALMGQGSGDRPDG